MKRGFHLGQDKANVKETLLLNIKATILIYAIYGMYHFTAENFRIMTHIS